MINITYKDLLDAGAHFGHLTRKWDPKMAPYIFMEKNGIHLIDINKTLVCLEDACKEIKNIARTGKKIMFVATKKQAQEAVAREAEALHMPYVTERWLGGMLTNFATIRKSLKKLSNIDRMMKDEAYSKLAKRERLMMFREKEKLERLLGGVSQMKGTPAALFIIDVKREHIAIAEAQRLGIPVFAIVDTNSNPNLVDYPIPANDDAFKSISIILSAVAEAIKEGISEKKKDKDAEVSKEDEAEKRQVDEEVAE